MVNFKQSTCCKCFGFWILTNRSLFMCKMKIWRKKTKCVPTLILLHRNLQMIPPAPFPPSIKPRWELIFCRFKDSRATSSTSPDTSQKRRGASQGVSGEGCPVGWETTSPWKLRGRKCCWLFGWLGKLIGKIYTPEI